MMIRRRLAALTLAGALLAGAAACEWENPGSPNGSCAQTPGQCGHRG